MNLLGGIKTAFSVIFGKTLTTLPEITSVPPMPAVQPAKVAQTFRELYPNPLSIVSPTNNTIEQVALNIFKGNNMNYILLISTLISSVKAIEGLMPASAGRDKAEAVTATIEGIFGQVPNILPLISAIVAGLNAVGIFTKKAPVAA